MVAVIKETVEAPPKPREVTYGAVILAAGRNTRLKGLIPSYHKPLVIVNGKPLLVGIIQNLLQLVNSIAVVVSPQNAQVISEVLSDCDLAASVSIIVQPEAKGPGDAVIRGQVGAVAERLVVICADNIIPKSDLLSAINQDTIICSSLTVEDAESRVTVSHTETSDDSEASRFTRVKKVDGTWNFIENAPGGAWEDGNYRCWVGPLIADRFSLVTAIRQLHSLRSETQELKIGPALNFIQNVDVELVPGHSYDIGTSDALFEASRETLNG